MKPTPENTGPECPSPLRDMAMGAPDHQHPRATRGECNDTGSIRRVAARKIESHKTDPLTDLIEIAAVDQLGPGGANHVYLIYHPQYGDGMNVSSLRFQKGPIQEEGVNGITNEALLAIVGDRLNCFASGPYADAYTVKALEHVRAAMTYLHDRTRERRARGVEGRNLR